MDTPKIQLSADEMQLVLNSEWILTKHRIIEKVYHLFGGLSTQMQLYLQQSNILPQEVLQLPPKISKGEQYEALPYVVLDYPRFFSKENVLAVRCFFWWGNYFSITLHLKGIFLEQYRLKIEKAIAENKLNGFYFSLSGNEFSFNLSSKNYFTIGNNSNAYAEEMKQSSFLKISNKISFKNWDTAEQKLMETFQHLMKIIGE